MEQSILLKEINTILSNIDKETARVRALLSLIESAECDADNSSAGSSVRFVSVVETELKPVVKTEVKPEVKPEVESIVKPEVNSGVSPVVEPVVEPSVRPVVESAPVKSSQLHRVDGRLISDLRRAIGLNDRIRFLRELFNGDAQLMDATIGYLNDASSYIEALEYLAENFNWDDENDTVKYFKDILSRKSY